jgi:hypothetical protein
MKAKNYKVMHVAVEEGLKYGIKRIFKHRLEEGGISEEDLVKEIPELEHQVMQAICDWFIFDDLDKQ